MNIHLSGEVNSRIFSVENDWPEEVPTSLPKDAQGTDPSPTLHLAAYWIWGKILKHPGPAWVSLR